MVSRPGEGSSKSREAAGCHAAHSVFRFFIRSSTPLSSGRSEGSQCAVSGAGGPQSLQTTKRADASADSAQSGRIRVLLVEDNVINQTALRRQLVKVGLSCDGEYNNC